MKTDLNISETLQKFKLRTKKPTFGSNILIFY